MIWIVIISVAIAGYSYFQWKWTEATFSTFIGKIADGEWQVYKQGEEYVVDMRNDKG